MDPSALCFCYQKMLVKLVVIMSNQDNLTFTKDSKFLSDLYKGRALLDHLISDAMDTSSFYRNLYFRVNKMTKGALFKRIISSNFYDTIFGRSQTSGLGIIVNGAFHEGSDFKCDLGIRKEPF